MWPPLPPFQLVSQRERTSLYFERPMRMARPPARRLRLWFQPAARALRAWWRRQVLHHLPQQAPTTARLFGLSIWQS